uniref:Uncharacterized protein n=1 Tax=Arundo donax TaxID=35708 RepID=A0A0A9GWC2_ARUDO
MPILKPTCRLLPITASSPTSHNITMQSWILRKPHVLIISCHPKAEAVHEPWRLLLMLRHRPFLEMERHRPLVQW